jgi:ADP-ribose pyrophosphatase YjhB (NUDIX family)
MSYFQELRHLVGHRPLILVGAQVIIFDQDRRLLLQYRSDDSTWGLPGGFMEMGETIEENARREVKEETGLDLGALTLFGIYSGKDYFYTCPNGDQVYAVIAVYITHEVTGRLAADGEESTEVRYFMANQLPAEMLPPMRGIIEDYMNSGVA